jgi:hypothetical protein
MRLLKVASSHMLILTGLPESDTPQKVSIVL